MKALQDSWSAEVAYHIGTGVTVTKADSGYSVNLPCEVCSQTFEYRIAKRFPPDIIRKKLRTSGWRVDNHLVCTHCVKTRPNGLSKRGKLLQGTSLRTTIAPTAEEIVEVIPLATPQLPEEPVQKLASLAELKVLLPAAPSTTPAPAEVTAPPQEPSAAAPDPVTEVTPQGHRRTMALLETYFDDSARQYKSDSDGKPYSDARIAEEAVVPLAHVVEQRTRYFGELGAPPELDNIGREMEALRQQIAAVLQEAEQLAERGLEDARQRAEALRAAAKAATEDLSVKLEVLDSEFRSVMARYGG